MFESPQPDGKLVAFPSNNSGRKDLLQQIDWPSWTFPVVDFAYIVHTFLYSRSLWLHDNQVPHNALKQLQMNIRLQVCYFCLFIVLDRR